MEDQKPTQEVHSAKIGQNLAKIEICPDLEAISVNTMVSNPIPSTSTKSISSNLPKKKITKGMNKKKCSNINNKNLKPCFGFDVKSKKSGKKCHKNATFRPSTPSNFRKNPSKIVLINGCEVTLRHCR